MSNNRLEAEIGILGGFGVEFSGDEFHTLRIMPWDNLDEEVAEFAPGPNKSYEFAPINLITDSRDFLWFLTRLHPHDQYQTAAAVWSICGSYAILVDLSI